jgi:hypothetical protein
MNQESFRPLLMSIPTATGFLQRMLLSSRMCETLLYVADEILPQKSRGQMASVGIIA